MPQKSEAGSGSAQPVGAGDHVVSSGECIISIADGAGHFWETLWNDPENAELKRVRGSPHVLLAGDRVHVPEIRPKEESCGTEAKHRFKRKGIPIEFEMLVEENGEPLSGKRYVLSIEGRVKEGTIPSDGVIKAPMFPKDQSGELKVYVGSVVRVYPLTFGSLDPAHTPEGVRGRLKNLGYMGDTDDPEVIEAAISQFQKDEGLSVTGEADDATARKLAEVHGS